MRLVLPSLGLTQLEDARQLGRHRVMAQEHRPHAPLARRVEHPQDVGQHAIAVGDLAQDPHLHVVDDKRQRRRFQRVVERFGDVEVVEAVHAAERYPPRAVPNVP